MNTDIKISDHIITQFPCRLGIIEAQVEVKEHDDLRALKAVQLEHAASALQEKSEKDFDVVADTRTAYKAFGKEPSRYRPSAEALCKRIRTGKGLYTVNNVVDIINLLSITTKYSIGGFDAKYIQGNITLDIGDQNVYEAIGRGALNIQCMPGLRDEKGFFGTPTSDSQRTMVRQDTRSLLLVFYDFSSHPSLEESLDLAVDWIETYCYGTEIQRRII